MNSSGTSPSASAADEARERAPDVDGHALAEPLERGVRAIDGAFVAMERARDVVSPRVQHALQQSTRCRTGAVTHHPLHERTGPRVDVGRRRCGRPEGEDRGGLIPAARAATAHFSRRRCGIVP